MTGELPLGWKQRLALGCAVLHEPPILFLDEPTSGVDPSARREFWDLINDLAQGGTTIFVSTHYMEEAEYCNRMVLMNRGRVVAVDDPGGLRGRMTDPIFEIATPLRPRRWRLSGDRTGFWRLPCSDETSTWWWTMTWRVASWFAAPVGEGCPHDLTRASHPLPGRRLRGVDPGRGWGEWRDRRSWTSYRLFAIARKEAVQLRRDTRSLILAFVLPLFMVLFFGYAISWDVKDIRLAVWDQDGTRGSRELAEAFEASGYFSIEAHPRSYQEAEGPLSRAEVRAVLVIPTGYERDLGAGMQVPVQLLLDGSDANTATIASNYAEAIVARHSAQILLKGRPSRSWPTAETRIWYNETLASRNMVVPGLIAVIMSIIAAMLTSLTIAREWERGTMEQLASTPVRAWKSYWANSFPISLSGFSTFAWS